MHKLVKAEIDNLQERIEHVRLFDKHFDVVDKLKESIESETDLIIHPRISMDYLYLDVHGLTDQHSITPVIKFLTKQGYHLKSDAWSYSSDKTLNWTMAPFYISGHFTGSVCKFVKVSEKTEDVYELRCS